MKNSIFKNYIYNLIYQIVVIILPLITTPYLSRVLGAENIGIYSYTLSIVTYFILFGSLGVAMYGQREIAYSQNDKKGRSQKFWEIVLFRFITLSISAVIFYLTYASTGEYKVYYQIFLLEIIANMLDISWFFQGMEEFKKTVGRNLIIRILSVILIFILVKNQNDLAKYILIYVLTTFIGNISLWFYLPKYIQKLSLKHLNLKQHIKPTIALFIPQIATQIYTVLDKTMIGNILGDMSEVGYYEQGQKITKLTLAIITALGTVVAPRIANTYISGQKEEINQYLKRSFNFVWFLACPMIAGLIAVSSNFVPLFYGEGYDKVASILCVISPLILAIGLNNVTGVQYLIQVKKQKIYTITVIIGAVVNVILNFILINVLKSVGAAIASVVAETAILIAQLIFVRKDIDIRNVYKGSWKYILSSLIMFITTILLKDITTSTFYNLVIQIGVGIITYFVILAILKDMFLKEFIQRCLNKFKLKKA